MDSFKQKCVDDPQIVMKNVLEMHSRPAKRIFDYSNKISELESEIEMIHKVVKKVTSPEVFDKFNSQLEKKKQKLGVDK